jgi:hypothetical protein
MVDHLSTLIEAFPGAANQTRCFTHILNLTAKSILRQFDAPKKAENGEDLGDAMSALEALARELEVGEKEDDEEDEDKEENDENGLENDRAGMSEEEVAELEESLGPIWLMLTKVNENLLVKNQLELRLSFQSASCYCQRNQKLYHHPSPSMA